jgi:adenosylcobinamide-GDP ribazoletransferase
MYSKIPMPKVDWKKENMRFVLCFLPLVGAVLGLLWYLLFRLLIYIGAGTTARACLLTALPILLSGGIHVDGYMDTMDARNSWGSREKKLMILEDSHIGAFSVIMTIVYYLLMLASVSEVNAEYALIAAFGFAYARSLTGTAMVYMPGNKREGLAYTFAETSDKPKVRIALLVSNVLWSAMMIIVSPYAGFAAVAAGALWALIFCRKMEREFGGLSGDLCGCLILELELVFAAVAAAASLIMI